MVQTQRGGVEQVVVATVGQIYYVPQIKYAVKIVDEQYNSDNVRVYRETQSLISFRPAG